jgi:ATP-dependent helicase HrpA
LPALAALRGDAFDWQIPGLRHDLVTALIKALPKNKRVALVPAPDTATAVLDRLGGDPGEPILPALEREFRRMTGVLIARADWDMTRVPEHLKMTYRVVDESGRALAEGKDLEALRVKLRVQARAAVASVTDGMEQAGLTSWPSTGRPDNALPAALERRRGSYAVTAYPALADEGTTVAVRVFEEPRAAARAMAGGVRRLLLLSVNSPVPLISKRLSNDAKLTLMRNPSGNVGQLMADCVDAAVDALVDAAGGPARDEPAFVRLRDHVRSELHDTTYDVVQRVRTVLAAWHTVSAKLDTAPAGPSVTDIRAQLGQLVYPGFVTATGADRLVDVARYLRAIEKRLERLATDARRDAAQLEIVEAVQDEYAGWLTELPPGAASWTEVRAVRWMIEELRVNLFAQALGTPYPVSEKRIYKAMDDVSA